MDLAALIEAINKLLAAIGVDPLPETVNEETLVPLLEGVALAIGQVGHEEPDGDEQFADGDDDDLGPDSNTADATGANTSVKMTNALRAIVGEALAPFSAQLAAVSAKVGLEVQSVEEAEKGRYMLFRNELAKAGVSEATLLGKDALALQLGKWNPALLEGLSPTITMTNVSRMAASATPVEQQDVEVESDKETDDEVAARLKARGIDPKFMPKAGS
jgi:hypothetical protein